MAVRMGHGMSPLCMLDGICWVRNLPKSPVYFGDKFS